MCGISGFNWQDREAVEKMSGTTSHRGPDATGFFCDEGISFGHNRLSIIDLSPDANQPMHNHAGNLVIIFNGEIYNFKELKGELSDYPFRTQSDTEVILAGYEKWGKDVVTKLNGIYSFAIWNKTQKELFIARDHAGIKPLYYFFDGSRFIFASEVKALLSHDIPRKLNIEAFNYYMRVNYAPAPLTMIQGISKLLPGSTLTLKAQNLEIKACKPGLLPTSHLSYTEAKTRLRSEVMEAVGRQLVSDVPVGVYLSGGIDSSAVLFCMKQFQENIKTFSVGFELPNKNDEKKFSYDFELAKKTAEFFHVDHHPLTMTGEDVVSLFEEVVIQNDAPVSNPTAIAMMFLARHTKKEVTVVLSGNGGDELFGGYERYRITLLAKYYHTLPVWIRTILNIFPTLRKLDFQSDVDIYGRFMFEKDERIFPLIQDAFFQKDSYIKEWFYDKYLSSAQGDLVLRSMQTDRESWLPDQALELADKMSMSAGLEERVPLLDKKLISFVTTLPRNYLVTLLNTKKIFKDAFRVDLPEFLFQQPKRGWMAPGAKWLRDPQVSALARDILSPDYYEPMKDIWNWDELQKMLENHIEMKEYNLTLIWSTLTFQAWAKQYKITL